MLSAPLLNGFRCAAITLLAVIAASGCRRPSIAAQSDGSADSSKAAVVQQGEEVAAAVWDSRQQCEQVWAKRGGAPHVPRIATWNVRYFPDGVEANHPDPERATDVEWLACSLALLDAELIVVQEFKRTARADAQAAALIASLNRRTGGDWKLELARCWAKDVQHPGFLYDASRVTGTSFRDLPALNPREACTNMASPGFAGYFEFAAGPDTHVVALHLEAGTSATAMRYRAESLRELDGAIKRLQAVEPDQDVVVTGDFNNSGCEDCDPQVAPAAELSAVKAMLAATSARLRTIEPTEPCSFRGETFDLLDHFAVSHAMREVAQSASARVSGFCAATRCSTDRKVPRASQRLSDHCPVLIELEPGDFD